MPNRRSPKLDDSVQQELDQESAQKAVLGKSDYDLRYTKERGYFRAPNTAVPTKPSKPLPPEHHSNPTEYWGPGEADGAVSDNAGPLQAIDPSEQMDQNVDGPDEFFCDWGDRPDLEWPGEKVRQRGRRQAY